MGPLHNKASQERNKVNNLFSICYITVQTVCCSNVTLRKYPISDYVDIYINKSRIEHFVEEIKTGELVNKRSNEELNKQWIIIVAYTVGRLSYRVDFENRRLSERLRGIDAKKRDR